LGAVFKLRRIDQDTIAAAFRRRCEVCFVDTTSAEDMKNSFSINKQIISDNPAVAPPPEGLRTHDGASLTMTELAQLPESRLKFTAHRVVCIIVKTLVLPESIGLDRNASLSRPQTPQLGNVPVFYGTRDQ